MLFHVVLKGWTYFNYILHKGRDYFENIPLII